MRPDGLLSTREAAEKWGCTPNNLIVMMGRRGYRPWVEQRPTKHGGVITAYWWHPTDVLMARRASRRAKAESGAKNITRWNDLPPEVREARVRDRRMKRLRAYYQAKAARRAAA